MIKENAGLKWEFSASKRCGKYDISEWVVWIILSQLVQFQMPLSSYARISPQNVSEFYTYFTVLVVCRDIQIIWKRETVVKVTRFFEKINNFKMDRWKPQDFIQSKGKRTAEEGIIYRNSNINKTSKLRILECLYCLMRTMILYSFLINSQLFVSIVLDFNNFHVSMHHQY